MITQYRYHALARNAGCFGLGFIWLKAMSISALVWTLGFCFVLMGMVLPWGALDFINWMLIAFGLAVFYGAYRLDKVIWHYFRQARQALKQQHEQAGGTGIGPTEG